MCRAGSSITLTDLERHGIPKSVFCDSWVVGFWRGADHGWQDVGLERRELGRWLKPFLDRLGHKTRRQMCPLYVSGLIGPGDHSAEVERLALGDMINCTASLRAGVWDATPVETELLVQADRFVGGRDAGDRRYRDTQERRAFGRCRCAICFGAGQDCQLPDPGIACARRSSGRAGVAVFLPESWTSKRTGLERAGVPAPNPL